MRFFGIFGRWVVLVAVIVVAIVGFYVFNAFQAERGRAMPEQERGSTQADRTPTSTEPGIPALADGTVAPGHGTPASWETYTNSALHVTLRYPPGWSLKVSDRQLIVRSPDASPDFEEPTSGAEVDIEFHPQPTPVDSGHLRNLTRSTDTLKILAVHQGSFSGRPALSYQADDATEATIEGVNVGLHDGFLRMLFKNFGHGPTDAQTLEQIKSSILIITNQ